MKTIILTLGAPGAGKSTFIEQMRWTPFTVSPDAWRQILAGPELGPDGNLALNQNVSRQAFEQCYAQLEKRMARGEFIVFDSTLPAKEWTTLEKFAKEHHYKIGVIDFRSLPLSTLLKQNGLRPPHKQVPKEAIERIYQDRAIFQKPSLFSSNHSPHRWFEYQHGDPTQTQEAIETWLSTPVLNFNHYQRIHFIGDLQGCLEPAQTYLSQIHPNEAYIFLGDLLDRGPDNGKVLQWALRLQHYPNIFWIKGNHELHLERWAHGKEAVSQEFEERTLPQLVDAGITREEVKSLLSKMSLVYWYEAFGQQVQVCHGGLSTVPERPYLIADTQWLKGSGQYQEDVDLQFSQHAPLGWIQVHGHRNRHSGPVRTELRSHALENLIEYGGFLRTAIHDSSGWSFQEWPNLHYLGPRERLKPPFHQEILGPWILSPVNTQIDEKTFQAMSEHPGIEMKSLKKTPHIVSVNFTKEVFYQASWDAVVNKARGLFINTDTQEIVSRGYEKFFNIDEREETKLENLDQLLTFPVTAYLKENGFLGNIGIDLTDQKLFIASKSSNGGLYQQCFQEHLFKKLDERQRHQLWVDLKDQEACAVFEVMDPVFDPHLIDYDAPRLVLLDVFHRSLSGAKYPYEQLVHWGQRWGFDIKERSMTFHTAQQLQKFIQTATHDLSYRYKGKDIEGFVLEGANGAQTKLKLPHYAFWKRMRATTAKIARLICQTPYVRPEWLLSESSMTSIQDQILEHRATVKTHKGQGQQAQEALQSIRDLSLRIEQHKQAIQAKANHLFSEYYPAIDHLVKVDSHPLAQSFLQWFLTLPREAHERVNNRKIPKNEPHGWLDILELRKMYVTSGHYQKEWLMTPWMDFRFSEDEDEQSDYETQAASDSMASQKPTKLKT